VSTPKDDVAARLIRYADARHYLWGDAISGQVKDWYYGSSSKIHMAMFSLPPGGMWRHSDRHKSYYYADECYYLLAGELTMHNPETGDVAVLHAGEALTFRERTWHYGYNFAGVETSIICTFAPVPEDISSAAAQAAAVPPLTEIRQGRWELTGRDGYPWNREEARRTERFRILPPSDWLPVIQGLERPIRVDLMIATDKQTSGLFRLLPGVTTDRETHHGDEVVFCVSGQASLYLPDTDEWFELHSKDGAWVREGVSHRWYNTSGEPASVFFGVAPRYL
jgi:mannose-6-phosphate isomerase-like protein (cupin superfamily)